MRSSIAMATYNGEKYIKEQIESLMNQTVLPYEIVISDDGSHDNTIAIINELIEKYSDSPVRFVLLNNTCEHGVRGNFENALINTTGDLVFLCDQDDIWLPKKIETCEKIMRNSEENMLFHNSKLLVQQEDGTFMLTNETIFSNSNIWYLEQYLQKNNSKTSVHKLKKVIF